MGKCLSINPSQKYDRIALDDYIQNLKQAKSVRRSTIILFQEISNLADMKLVTRAKIKDNKVKKSQLKEMIKEASEINSMKIYSDYYRYTDSRKSAVSTAHSTEIIRIQISLLDKNLKRFPYIFASKYLITQSVYDSSIFYYWDDPSIFNTIISSLVQAFVKCEEWVDPPDYENCVDIIKEICKFWKNYLKDHQIHKLEDAIVAKALEGDYFLDSKKLNEVVILVGLYNSGFYDEKNKDWENLRNKYNGLIDKAVENTEFVEKLKIFGAIGLLQLKEIHN